MTTKNKFRLFSFIVGSLVIAASTYSLYRQWDQPLDKSWTPQYLAQDLAGVKDTVEIFVGGEPLTKVLAEGRLTVTGKDGPLVVPASSVQVRTNNYAPERVSRVPAALVAAAALGGGLVLLLLGLIVPLLGEVISDKGQLTQLHLLES